MTTPPWIININNPSVVGTSQLLYDRLIEVRRLKTVAGSSDAIGDVGYSGAEQSTSGPEGEIIMFSKIPASVQLAAAGRTTKSGELPGDAVTKAVWNISIPISALSQYSIRDRDIIKDDEGYRYQVGANYFTSFGYQLSTIRLEA